MPDIHALTFNAITCALSEAGRFVKLSEREAIAAAVEAAIEPEIRSDEQQRIAAEILAFKTPCPVHGDTLIAVTGMPCWHCSYNAALHKAARVAYGQPWPAELPEVPGA
jgi:hypothetical protein